MQQHRSRRAARPTAEEAFGQVLKELRRQRGISQEELAFKSGYHPTYVSLLERGQKSPSLRTIMSLSTALDTQPSEILRQVEKLTV
ncbi:MAG: helix-turn-helix transcriptional regulator [Acidobacteriaceae bacterium]